MVVIDFETTGLIAGEDEVLQVAIIDGKENTLLNTYCKPQKKTRWDDAQNVHSITPDMVVNERPFEDYAPAVHAILNRADKVIAYNTTFEDSFLKAYGINVDEDKWIDPMIIFAEIYGEYTDYAIHMHQCCCMKE